MFRKDQLHLLKYVQKKLVEWLTHSECILTNMDDVFMYIERLLYLNLGH